MEPVYIILIILAVIAGIVLLFFIGARSEAIRPLDKGKRGEAQIAAILRQYARPDDKIINDILLYDADTGKSAQIDHIFISAAGIYVIETKNYSGEIYGSENQREWTQVLAGGNTKNKLPSPVKQNATHIYLVKKITGRRYHTDGMVVFVQGNARHIADASVMTVPQFCTSLENLQSCHLLTPADIRDAYEKLIQNRDSYKITPEEHMKNIRKTQNDIARNICPRCGKKLVLRDGKYGRFYGCSGYPDCKFTKDV